MVKDEIKELLANRFSFVFEDAKTYIFVRKEGIQEKEGLGGGNFTIAYSLFALLNVASKVHYFLHKPNKFTDGPYQDKVKDLKIRLLDEYSGEERKIIRDHFMIPREMETNELNAFVEFARELESSGLVIRLERYSSHEDYSTIWSGFRNMLSHLATVQNGKGVMALTLAKHWPSEIKTSTPIEDVLEMIKDESKKFPPFFFVADRSGWVMNVDALVALIPELESTTIKCIDESKLDEVQLRKLLDFIQPS